ncbi:MAG TPA: hypothetical protein VM282_19230 [Acidimicrobiales bacterium]|nr:hypothetical protein [Acidimicrobiales bacterium]
MLASANALVDATGAVDAQRLDTFAKVLLAPGMAGALAYEPIVPDEQRAQFEAKFGLRIIDRAADGTFVDAPRRPVYELGKALVTPVVPLAPSTRPGY